MGYQRTSNGRKGGGSVFDRIAAKVEGVTEEA